MSLIEEKELFTLKIYPDGCKTDMNVGSEAEIQELVYSLVSMFEQAPHIRSLFALAIETSEEIDHGELDNVDTHLLS